MVAVIEGLIGASDVKMGNKRYYTPILLVPSLSLRSDGSPSADLKLLAEF